MRSMHCSWKRAHIAWHPQPVPEGLLREAYAIARMGPTSANSSPPASSS